MTTSRAEEIGRTLAQRIVEGDIAPGDRLPSEGRLVEEFGASRTVIREALQRLQSRGLVRTRVGSGSYALTPPSDTGSEEWLTARSDVERDELHGLRIAIESEAAALAARDPSPAVLAEIDAALAAFIDAALPSHSVETDFAFHRAIAAASDNRYLLAMLDRLGPRAIVLPAARIAEEDRDGEETAAVLAEHRAIAMAIHRADPLAAAAAMRAHLTASTARRSSH